MQDRIVIVGLNHRTAPVDVRERYAFERPALAEPLRRLRLLFSLKEGVILSTCNRVEVVAVTSDEALAFDEIKEFLAKQERGEDPATIEGYFYTYSGDDAVRHLFRVAASLDSMVVGEPQILGQLKDHYLAAHEAGSVGAVLHRLFHRSFSVAKRVRNETGIGSGAVSVGSVAVDLARRIFEQLDQKVAMVIGAGKMAEQVLRHLQRAGVTRLMVTNRTFERARGVADQFHGSLLRFEDHPRYLRLADLVVGCTSATEVLLRREEVVEILKERKHQPMFFIDLGTPRNFDPRIHEVDNAYLYHMDDLKEVAQEHLEGRIQEARRAEEVVSEEVAMFLRWLDSLEQVPTIVALRDKLETIRQRELERSLHTSLKGLSEKEREALEDMTAAIINKILHAPISHLKRRGDGTEEVLYIEALKRLFNLREED